MNFKILLVLGFVFSVVWAQGRLSDLSKEDVEFLENLSPQVAPEIIPYEGMKINRKKSYRASLYKKKKVISAYEDNRNRLRQALLYKRNGNIESFSEILEDVILEFNYTLLAPQAAVLLGDFEYSIFNQESAFLYYLYTVNNHFNSPLGWEAYYKLGLVLSKKQNFKEAEKIMNEILKSSKNPFYKEAKQFLEQRYLLLSKVAFQDEDFRDAKKYLDSYKRVSGLEAASSK